ncbi:helix-turn-helix transcriptional regulator [Phenylobacterium sp. J367]|uniref:helix-turn-helix domain-containing protein n=1 Tax=Phenylobacterium sp. J367 TaxID=2898435 RepID=UPI00215123E2|nr:helix-turn-helix transcriptional regulator [Phenylobacterium sp. J367]MCR5879674.1 helix-turn-helix domain-containing protein [Phenylobacterium sp. J367]
MDVLRDRDKAAQRATLSRVLKLLRTRAGLRSVEAARMMNKGHRTYQRWESGYYGVELDDIHRFAEIVHADPWGIIFAVEFGSVDFALDAAQNGAASLLLVALRRFHRQPNGKALRQLDPRSLSLTYSRGFELLARRAEEYAADLEQWMFDEELSGRDPDDDDGSR